jgi:hypothetical protein
MQVQAVVRLYSLTYGKPIGEDSGGGGGIRWN